MFRSLSSNRELKKKKKACASLLLTAVCCVVPNFQTKRCTRSQGRCEKWGGEGHGEGKSRVRSVSQSQCPCVTPPAASAHLLTWGWIQWGMQSPSSRQGPEHFQRHKQGGFPRLAVPLPLLLTWHSQGSFLSTNCQVHPKTKKAEVACERWLRLLGSKKFRLQQWWTAGCTHSKYFSTAWPLLTVPQNASSPLCLHSTTG